MLKKKIITVIKFGQVFPAFVQLKVWATSPNEKVGKKVKLVKQFCFVPKETSYYRFDCISALISSVL